MEVSVKEEARNALYSQCLTLTAEIHSPRSLGDKLLHSRRTEGLVQPLLAVTDCPRRVAATRASFTKRQNNIFRDGRMYRVSRVLADGQKRRRGGPRAEGDQGLEG